MPRSRAQLRSSAISGPVRGGRARRRQRKSNGGVRRGVVAGDEHLAARRPSTACPRASSRGNTPPTIGAGVADAGYARGRVSSADCGSIPPFAVPMTTRSVLPQAEPIRSSNVWRIVPTSSRTPNTIPTPSTTPKAVSTARSGRRAQLADGEAVDGAQHHGPAAGSGTLVAGSSVAKNSMTRCVEPPAHLAGDAAVAQEHDAIGDRRGATGRA